MEVRPGWLTTNLDCAEISQVRDEIFKIEFSRASNAAKKAIDRRKVGRDRETREFNANLGMLTRPNLIPNERQLEDGSVVRSRENQSGGSRSRTDAPAGPVVPVVPVTAQIARDETLGTRQRATVCYRCGDTGHIRRDCPRTNQNSSNVLAVDAEGDEDSRRALKGVLVNGRHWSAKVDSEADVSIISEKAARELNLEWGPSELTSIRGAGGEPFKPLGCSEVLMRMDDLRVENVPLTVVPNEFWSGREILIGKDLINHGFVTIFCDGFSWVLKKEIFEDMARRYLPNEYPRVDFALKNKSNRIDIMVGNNVKLKPRSVEFVMVKP